MTYFISDIHGEYGLLSRLLENLNFSASDRLYVLGDMIDKGDESVRTVKFLRLMENVTCIMGNHEHDFLRHYRMLKNNGDYSEDEILERLQSRFFDGKLLSWEIIKWLEGLEYYVEGKNFVGVHAGVPLERGGRIAELSKVKSEQFIYDRAFVSSKMPAVGEKCVIFGHTPVRFVRGGDEIIAYSNGVKGASGIRQFSKIHIDTGVYLSGILGCFCLENCKTYYQRKI